MTMPPAQHLLLNLLVGSFGAQPVTSLVRAAEILGIEPNATRVALTRLKSRGLVSNPRRGYWEAGPRAQPLHAHIKSWRELNQRALAWDGTSWIMTYTGGIPQEEVQLRSRTHALSFLGFAHVEPHLYMRPDNLLGGIADVRTKLLDLGLESSAMVATIASLADEDQSRALLCWDTDSLNESYAQSTETLKQARVDIEQMDLEDAARHAYVVGEKIVSTLVQDPILPAQMVDVYARANLVDLMRTFDTLGHELWRQVLTP